MDATVPGSKGYEEAVQVWEGREKKLSVVFTDDVSHQLEISFTVNAADFVCRRILLTMTRICIMVICHFTDVLVIRLSRSSRQ